MFFLQPTLNTLELKEDKGTESIIGWKSKRVYTYKLTPLYIVFFHNIKLSGYIIRIKFNNSVLVLEQINYKTKLVNVYIVYDLDTWLKNSS